MSWLTPIGFLGLIGLVILIIIYIIKPNYQNKIISSTFIWKLSLKLRKKQIPISKLRNILLFICQVLAITTLAAMLAQPVIVAEQEEKKSEKIVIIDASLSMFTDFGGETRFERAVESIRLLANETFSEESNDTITVILASDTPKVLASSVSFENKNLVFEALDELVDPSNRVDGKMAPLIYTKADIDAAVKIAEEKTSIEPNSEVLLYTDTKYIDPGKIVIKDVKNPAEWNASILDVRAIVDENYYRFEIDVAVYGGVDADINVFLDIYGVNSDKDNLQLSATARCIGGQTTTLVFAKNRDNGLSIEENGINVEAIVFSYETASIKIEENDNFKYDNSFELYGGAKLPLRIQYVSSNPNNFFSAALLVLRDALGKNWEVEFIEVKPHEEPAKEGFDFYIYEHDRVPNDLPVDGVIILADPHSIPARAGITLGRSYTTQNMSQVNLTGVETDHPLMNNINAENVTVTKFTELRTADEYATLMAVQDVPVIMAKNTPDQKIVVMSFSLHYSNFSILLDFPLFMYNIFEYYSPSTFTEHSYNVNDEITLNSRSEMLEVMDGYDNLITEITEFPSTLKLNVPGTYKVYQTPISGNRIEECFFVKMPADECNISAETDALQNPFFAQEEKREDLDLLLYFALALVALLFAEWWLQSREQF